MENSSVKLGEREVGSGFPVYIIAEMSANHAAKESGADCVKIQTYTPDTMTIDCINNNFIIEKGTWKGENLYDLYGKAFTPWEWQADLKAEAEKTGLDFLSTAYEETSVDFLEDLGIAFYKVASFELTHIPFLKYLASKSKPIILSTGMASLEEIEEAVNAIRGQGNEQLVLLKCSSAYPAIASDMNLRGMEFLQEKYNVPVGFSDHSLESLTSVAAACLGACIVEKHFCLDRAIKNPDVSFSMEPAEFARMVSDIRIAESTLGNTDFDISEKEKMSKIFRRSVFAIKNITAGEGLTSENIRVIRPGSGLPPKHYPELIGRRAAVDIERGTPLEWDMIK